MGNNKYHKRSLIIFCLWILTSNSINGQDPFPPPFDSVKYLSRHKEQLQFRTINVTDSLYGTHGEFTYAVQFHFNCFIDSNKIIQLAFTHPIPRRTLVYSFKHGILSSVVVYDDDKPDEVYERNISVEEPRIFLVGSFGWGTRDLENVKFR